MDPNNGIRQIFFQLNPKFNLKKLILCFLCTENKEFFLVVLYEINEKSYFAVSGYFLVIDGFLPKLWLKADFLQIQSTIIKK